ncbi:MAG: cytochrome P450 [Hyphomonadaceae bacterium]
MADAAIFDTDVLIPASIVDTITDPGAYADDRIYAAYAWLRKNNPLGLARKDGFRPFWVVTRHADIMEISRRNDVFHAGATNNTFIDEAGAQRVLELNNGSPHLVASIVSMDLPVHPVYRALTQGWFMPANIKKREGEIRTIARRAVDRMAAMGGRCDFVADLALGYPLHVIMNIFGVPEEDERVMLKLTQELFGPQDPDITGEGKTLSANEYADYLAKTVQGFEAYFKNLSEARRREPRDDLASVIANAKVDGKQIGQREEFGYYITVATAGHDTTSTSTAAAMWELAANPAEFEKVKANPALIPQLVDEGIRWATPIKHFMRSAIADVEYGGRTFKAGDWIMLCYGSGNRDEAVFDQPDVFKADRSPNKHISFGYGPHLCLGQHLARMEMRILFEELLPRLKSVTLDGQPTRSKSWFINGPKTVPIRFEMS